MIAVVREIGHCNFVPQREWSSEEKNDIDEEIDFSKHVCLPGGRNQK